MKWFRMYSGVLNDPKVQRLEPFLFKCWVNLLCYAAENEGEIPGITEDIAFALRLSEDQAKEVIEELQARGLMEPTGDGLVPHNWENRQYESDSSTERVRRYRQKQRVSNETLQQRFSNGTEQTQNRLREDSEQTQSSTQPRAPARAREESSEEFSQLEKAAVTALERKGYDRDALEAMLRQKHAKGEAINEPFAYLSAAYNGKMADLHATGPPNGTGPPVMGGDPEIERLRARKSAQNAQKGRSP